MSYNACLMLPDSSAAEAESGGGSALRSAGPRRFLIGLAAALALADASIVTLGLPSILIELDATVEGVALVLGVYTAVLAIALPLAARLCRSAGAPLLGAAGFAVFGLASLACGLSGSLGLLLALRSVQALGGAATLVAAFELLGGRPGEPGRRAWVAIAVFGAASGPALGGILTELFDWRAIFLAQAPIAIPGLWALLRPLAPDTRKEEPAPIPIAGEPAPLRLALALALGLLSAALTAVIFLLVLLLVAGWSVAPLLAALTVTVLPLAALAGSRLGGKPSARAAAGCLLVAAGIACLALLPEASAAWTLAPQLLAGLGMGLALPALAGELHPEHSLADAARLLSVRHAGIALCLVALGPIVSASLDDEVATARESGTAVLLDARLDPATKFQLAPELLAGIDTDDPRGQLEREVDEARGGLEGEEAAELDRTADRLDGVLTDAVSDAFLIAFLITAGLALAAFLVLMIWSPIAGGLRRAAAVSAAALAAVVAVGGYAAADAASEEEQIEIANPCEPRELPETGGIGGALQDIGLAALDRAACEFGAGREELLLALFDNELAERFEEEHGTDPRSLTELGPALLGL